MEKMTILGLMSGTSLDGIDLALCQFDGIDYRILDAATLPYSDRWRQRLMSLHEASALDYALADVELGHFFGLEIRRFLDGKPFVVDAVASHGHTIFHQPHLGLTTQIGCGDAIAAETGLTVVSNFRTLDVALGGQGAPLVPIGDELLFGRYDACLNLGGIANISYRVDGVRVAFDVCPCNMALNPEARRLGLPFDPEGSHARRGHAHSCLLHQLDALDYYFAPGPKSLGKEWVDSRFRPLVGAAGLTAEDTLATLVSHIALQISHVVQRQQIASMLITGGGAWNSCLVERLADLCPEVQIFVPDALIVNYKEALVFALLGYLRLGGQVNTLQSVTGARVDSIGGNISGRLTK